MATIKTVGIFSKPRVPAAANVVPELMEWLLQRGVEARFDAETAGYLDGHHALPREQVPEGCELVIVLGGDGTLLSAARAIAGREIPLFAVNLGGLGFLTAIGIQDLFPELERAFRGEHRIGRRRLMRADLYRRDERIGRYEALNDVVITKADIARMIDVDAYANDQLVCCYKADGLIVSTSTGSTAYSLSAGGPIIYPSVNAICLTPICPHMLTNRPVLVPSEMSITIISKTQDCSAFLTIDGQVGEPLCESDRIECHLSEHALHLIRPPHKMFFDVLRQKLKWGER
ncbi:MAG TPA: NAD(+) kinase [Solibacterales bacterium]|jgi:NAD+ kinase|nr:NAD(+) kinase [Bryobacterales bacterium]